MHSTLIIALNIRFKNQFSIMIERKISESVNKSCFPWRIFGGAHLNTQFIFSLKVCNQLGEVAIFASSKLNNKFRKKYCNFRYYGRHVLLFTWQVAVQRCKFANALSCRETKGNFRCEETLESTDLDANCLV